MTDSFLFIQNSKNIAIYQDFVKFRKDSFHYILNILVKEKYFTTKLEAGKNLKSKFNQFNSVFYFGFAVWVLQILHSFAVVH